MYIDSILSTILSGQNSFYSFETFILNLLKIHLKSQNKEFKYIDDRRAYFDAFAPNGFDSFNGPTIIDIKLGIDKLHPSILVDKVMRSGSFELAEYDPEYYLIICGRPVIEKDKKRYLEEFENRFPYLKLVIWGPEEINSIAYKHRTDVKRIVDNIFSLRIEQVIDNDNDNWKEEREKTILMLLDTFKNRQFSLFLGAGVSSSSGMPNWNKLLNSLFVSYLTKEFNNDGKINDNDINDIVDRLNEVDNQSALMAARYLRKGLSKQGNDSAFINTITKSLYDLRDKNREVESHLFKSITNLCMPRQNGARIKTVITYNFDDLLEKNLNNKSIKHHSIYTDNETPSVDELPIYHVHGFLPEDRELYQSLERTTLVFSEEGYHHIYSDPYHWSNLIQLYNLKENNCLMIGLSMTDPNLRRLLDLSAKNIEQNRHFVFMNRLSIEKFLDTNSQHIGSTEENEYKKIKNVEGAEIFLKRHHKLNEEILNELKVNVIWYEDYSEIPEILNRLNNE